MQQLLKRFVCFFLSLNLCLISSPAVFAEKKQIVLKSLQAFSNDGEFTIYGSVLSPNKDEVNILLTNDLVSKIKRSKISRLSFTLTSTLDSTKNYIIPNDAVRLEKRIINGKPRTVLVFNLYNLFSLQSGLSVFPSSLPQDSYILKVRGVPVFGTTVNKDSQLFKYDPPTLIAGKVRSNGPGLITVEDFAGNQLSEKTVTTNADGSFITEVRAKKLKIKRKNSSTKNLKAQTVEEENTSSSSGEEDIT